MTLKILAAAALATATVATPAFAQTSTGTVSIDGSVANRCLFTTASDTISVGELALGGNDTTAGKLDASKLNGQSRQLTGWCNGTASTITVDARPIANTTVTAAPPSGFARVVNYTATATTTNNVTATDSSVLPAVGTPQNLGLYAGTITVALSDSAAPGNALLVAGTYQGSVVVTLSPTIVAQP